MKFLPHQIVTGERLQSLAQITILTREIYAFHKNVIQFAHPDQLFFIDTGTRVGNRLRDKRIIFVYTHLLDLFFEKIYLQLKDPIILVSHNSDHSVDKKYLPFLDEPNILYWYAQNISMEHPRLRALPIGIANSQWPHGNVHVLSHVMKEEREKAKWLYFNTNLKTNISERTKLLKYVRETSLTTLSPSKPFKEYLEELASHRFCLAPIGNGIDTHRVWECLYLGVIPIVRRHAHYEQFKDLPILFVDDWNEINQGFLEEKYKEFQQKNFKFDVLNMEYWKTQFV